MACETLAVELPQANLQLENNAQLVTTLHIWSHIGHNWSPRYTFGHTIGYNWWNIERNVILTRNNLRRICMRKDPTPSLAHSVSKSLFGCVKPSENLSRKSSWRTNCETVLVLRKTPGYEQLVITRRQIPVNAYHQNVPWCFPSYDPWVEASLTIFWTFVELKFSIKNQL